ncbi:MAG TPA: D-alanyl-D-alanine carboxypeptidase [Mycobacteriales bacterium]|nr:D-alanyl-D-alanine carboxypeptidase [Mycobacteriales bacterium]
MRRALTLAAVAPLALTLATGAVASPGRAASPARTADAPTAATIAHARTAAAKALAQAHGTAGLVVTLDDGTPLFDLSGDAALPPASTTKLFSVGTALLTLGADHRFATRVMRTGPAPDANGVLTGDLVLVGGGDPTLSRADLARLAASVKQAGVRQVTGVLRLDTHIFDTIRGAPGWRDYYVGYESGPLSAFVVDDNLWRSGTSYRVNPDPGNLALFRGLLKKQGVAIAGGNSTHAPPAPYAGTVAVHHSSTLGAIAARVLRSSNNTEAETLLKDTSLTAARKGSTAGGLAVVRAQASKLGVALPSTMNDGSGLSTRDYMPTRTVVAWINALGTTSIGGALRSALPLSCRNGTLKHRLCGAATAGRVAAKTGSLDYTAALAGFATTKGGRVVVFSCVVTGPPEYQDAKALDAAVTALVNGL